MSGEDKEPMMGQWAGRHRKTKPVSVWSELHTCKVPRKWGWWEKDEHPSLCADFSNLAPKAQRGPQKFI